MDRKALLYNYYLSKYDSSFGQGSGHISFRIVTWTKEGGLFSL